MAFMAGRARWHVRPDRLGGERNPAQSGFTATDSDRMESRRCAEDGLAALPLPLPVLRGERKSLMSALPAIGRHISRGAVQYRLLRASHDDDRAGDRT